MEFAYIMSPYTSNRFDVMSNRALLAAYAIADLMVSFIPRVQNTVLFSPIVHYHEVAQKAANIRRDSEYWKTINDLYINAADYGIVLTMPGWKSSVGVNNEINQFNSMKKEILYYVANWEQFTTGSISIVGGVGILSQSPEGEC